MGDVVSNYADDMSFGMNIKSSQAYHLFAVSCQHLIVWALVKKIILQLKSLQAVLFQVAKYLFSQA